MILVDTTILIDILKGRNHGIKEISKREKIAICGVVKAEILYGAKNLKDLKQLNNIISEIPSLPFSEEMWTKLGEMLFKLRKKGTKVPIQDAIISLIAIENKAKIWTKDKHFLMIKKYFQK